MASPLEEDGLDTDNYYTILNVSKTATKAEIDSAFRRFSKIYHPDKHVDPVRKKQAEVLFARLKEAHDVLTDEARREIYDKHGHIGLEVFGKEVITRTKSPAEVIAELDRYHKEQNERKLRQLTSPKGTVSVRINISDIFDNYKQNPDYELEDVNIEISGMSIVQSVKCPLTTKHTVEVVGVLDEENGRGQGNLSFIWHSLTSSTGNMTAELRLGTNKGGLFLSAFKQLFRGCHCSGALGFVSTRRGIMLSFSNSLVYQLDRNLMGKITYDVLKKAMRTDIVYENEYHSINMGVQLGIAASFCTAGYQRRFMSEDGPSTGKIGISGRLGTLESSIQCTCEKKISQFSFLKGSLSVGTRGVNLDISLRRGDQNFIFPIKLSEDIEPSAVFYGTLIPCVAYFAVKKLIVDPYIKQQQQEKQEHMKEEEEEKLLQKKQDAEAIVALMRETAANSIELEEKRSGLIIIKAIYGKLVTQDGELVESQCIDVRISLQSQVKESQLVLPSSASKSSIPGFYDPCPNEEKKLYIRYTFRNKPHEVSLNDTEPIRIPLQRHIMKEDTG